jgi:hypothetical protein
MPTVDATKIHQGPGKLYLKCPVPQSGKRLLIDSSGVPMNPAWAQNAAHNLGDEIVDPNSNLQRCTTPGTSGGQTPSWANTVGTTTTDGTVTWTCVALIANQFAGASEGAVTVALTPKLEPINADQVSAPIDVVMTAEAETIEVQLKESDLLKLSNYVVHGTYQTGADAGLPNNAQNYEELAFGGVIPIPQFSVAVVSPRRSVTGKFVVAQLYQAYQADAIQLPLQRGKETLYKVKFEAIADPSRPAGDQVGKIYRQT